MPSQAPTGYLPVVAFLAAGPAPHSGAGEHAVDREHERVGLAVAVAVEDRRVALRPVAAHVRDQPRHRPRDVEDAEAAVVADIREIAPERDVGARDVRVGGVDTGSAPSGSWRGTRTCARRGSSAACRCSSSGSCASAALGAATTVAASAHARTFHRRCIALPSQGMPVQRRRTYRTHFRSHAGRAGPLADIRATAWIRVSSGRDGNALRDLNAITPVHRAKPADGGESEAVRACRP